MLPDNVRSWVEIAVGGRVISATLMPGATSSLLHSVEIECRHAPRSVVLRRFVDQEWVNDEPDIAAREAASLQHATKAGLPAPELIACDATGEHCGVPATLVTRVPGTVVLEPSHSKQWVRGLAESAAQIHRVDAGGFPWTYRRFNEQLVLTVPSWSRQRAAWEQVIEIVEGKAPAYRECFVHRDYHPSNVLWESGRVSGVVDWVNGCRGPAGIDVAWCRHDLASLHGVAVADDFLDAYITAAGSEFEYDPYWDLMAVVELLPGPPSMYDGWRASGISDISDETIIERTDLYLASLIALL